MPSWETNCLAGILLLGLALRVLHFHAIIEAEFPTLMVTLADAGTYWEWAQSIREGDWLSRDTYHPYFPWMAEIAPMETWYRWWGDRQIFHQTPAYPYLIAAILALSNDSVESVLFIQLMIGALFPLVMYRLAKHMFDTRAALLAAATAAVYGPYIFHQGMLLRDWLIPITQSVLLLCLLAGLKSPRLLWWMGAGLAAGLAYLVKPTITLFFPLLLGWILWHGRTTPRLAAMRCALIMLGFFICLSPAILRNVALGVEPLAFNTRGAEAFIIGNAADADPVGLFLAPPSTKRILEISEGRTLPAIRETLKTFQGDYLRLAKFQLLKLRGLVNPYEPVNTENYNYGVEMSPILRVTPGFGLVFCFGVGGMLWLSRRSAPHQLFALFLLAALAALWFGPMRVRYRLTLVPILTIYGSALMVHLYDLFRSRSWMPFAKIAGSCLILSLVQYKLLALDNPRLYLPGGDYVKFANLYADEKRYDRAVEVMKRLQDKARATPDSDELVATAFVLEGSYRTRWAQELLDTNREDAAKEQTALAAKAYAAAPQLALLHYDLGLLYFRLGDREAAKASFEQFLSLGPDEEKADEVRRLLGMLALDEEDDQNP
jgi:hypothetical protein